MTPRAWYAECSHCGSRLLAGAWPMVVTAALSIALNEILARHAAEECPAMLERALAAEGGTEAERER